ncbi:hypothetical protein GCM10028803_03970 [Larkinella knui]|uniref:Histidine kinase n=1 Tax=Larkinella knui TaxID=2025310 RepID=A0A3P1CLG0_9BACT|nr:histidine kinase [Larkinella knui]RRB13916.1 histidine kinase [Larkinella knui]
MKKAVLVVIAGLLTVAAAKAQINWGAYSHSFPGEVQEKPSAVGLILAIRKENNAFWAIRETSDHFYTLNADSSFRRLRPREMVARTTFDTARAQFFLHGVGPQNAPLYQFRVTEYPGNRVLVPWRGINRFTDSTLIHDSGFPKMAYLGGYRTRLGSMLIMDVRKLEGNQIMATSLIAWESIKPVVTNVYTSDNIDEFLQRLQSPWLPFNQPAGRQSPVLTVSSTNTNLIFLLGSNAFSRNQLQYEVIRNGSVYTPWRNNDYDNSFVWIKEYPPGRYVLKMRFSVQPAHVTEFRFEIEPVWYQTNLFRILVGIFVAALLGAGLFLILLVQQRRKTWQEQAHKTKLQLELKAIYAQLNPHFVFNALSSIQSLVNKQDLKGANNYLSDFARLMRESLNHSHKDEIALQQEIQTLDTYLKLEQLRFNFQYKISVDSTVNGSETSVPALLLQPLVENAVKHGVAVLQENGYITVHVNQSDHTMIITITDNGNGYTERKSSAGLGLRLVRDRIKLLNELKPEQPISLTINTLVPRGTQITLAFTHWFL